MDNLWILTEERPKASVIKDIISIYCRDFNGKFEILLDGIQITPIIDNGLFQFTYDVSGIKVGDIENIFIKTVSGNSSFFDFLVFKQDQEPSENSSVAPLMAIEETKTSDDESRNTGVYQRGSKFIYLDYYYKDVKQYMLYNEELEAREDKKPSDTSIFGTNMLLTLQAEIVGKEIEKWFKPFVCLDDLISFKAAMRKPPAGNVPIEIIKYNNRIEVSGRLAKPADMGNIGHDPNIGALSLISKSIRELGWDKKIVVTKHGVTQNYIDRTNGNNKFLYICKILNLELEGLTLPEINLPNNYWHYEKKSEKITSIFLHVLAECHGMRGIYQNHAGCERGYFKTSTNKLITLPKKDKSGINLYLPDLVLHDNKNNTIYLIEGKQLSTLSAGIEEIKAYDSIENEFIKPAYPECNILRYISIFGGKLKNIPHNNVLIYINDSGEIYLNSNAPTPIKQIFAKYGV